MKPSFEIYNKIFSEKFREPSLFSVEDINFIKIAQHSLAYSISKNTKKLLRPVVHFPPRLVFLYFRLKYWIQNKNKGIKLKLRERVIIDHGRIKLDVQGHPHSVYFDKILVLLGRDWATVIKKDRNSALSEFDYCIADLKEDFSSSYFIDEEGFSLLRKINSMYKRIKKSKLFSSEELRYFRSSLSVFFQDFLFYYFIFNGSGTKYCLFICHYHNEGMIYALKRCGIRSIELQHGLISSKDLYYVYPEYMKSVRDKAMFPDRLMVYGDYWKQVLSKGYEFQSENITVLGDYVYSNSPMSAYDLSKKENVVLVATQTNFTDYYIRYIKDIHKIITDKHPAWRIWVKLHPSEKELEKFEDLRGYSNMDIFSGNTDISDLIKRCKIQVSIYSTTLYDALGFGVLNFSLQNYSHARDYAKNMVDEGIAQPLNIDDDPVEKYTVFTHSKAIETNRGYYYKSFTVDRAQLAEVFNK